MSYCGRCGSFYNAACPHYPLCAPAPNPHEERIADLVAQSVAAAAEIAGMVAANQHRERTGQSIAYDDQSFVEIAVRLRKQIGGEA